MKIFFTLLSTLLLFSSLYAEILTPKKQKLTYTLKADEPMNFQMTFTSPRENCTLNIKIVDDFNKLLLSANHNMLKSEEIFNLPVKTGKYYMEIVAGNSNCYNKTFDLKIDRIVGNFEEEPNNKISEATLLEDLKYYTGFLQSFNDNDYFKIILPAKGTLSLSLKHINYGQKGYNNIKLLDDKGNDIYYWSDNLDTKSSEKKIGLDKGTYFINVIYATSNSMHSDYSLAYSFSPNENIELELNQTPKNATPIADNVYITGYLKHTFDENDYYVYDGKSGNYNFIFEHKIFDENIDITIYNSSLKTIKNFTSKGISEKESFNIQLEDGKSYIKIKSYHLKNDEEYRFGLVRN
jgi:hypothetical protein